MASDPHIQTVKKLASPCIAWQFRRYLLKGALHWHILVTTHTFSPSNACTHVPTHVIALIRNLKNKHLLNCELKLKFENYITYTDQIIHTKMRVKNYTFMRMHLYTFMGVKSGQLYKIIYEYPQIFACVRCAPLEMHLWSESGEARGLGGRPLDEADALIETQVSQWTIRERGLTFRTHANAIPNRCIFTLQTHFFTSHRKHTNSRERGVIFHDRNCYT